MIPPMRQLAAGVAAIACAFNATLPARAAADPLADIRAEIRQRSRAMEWARALSREPRLTGSPALDAAGAWAERQLTELGLANVHLERWPFERRWTVDRLELDVAQPVALRVASVAQTWSPGTQGPVTGPLRGLRMNGRSTFEKEAGRLRGAFVLIQSGDSLPDEAQKRLQVFLSNEGALAALERSVGADGTVVYVRTGHTPEQDQRVLLVPSIAVRPDHFRDLGRLAGRGAAVVLRADLAVTQAPGGAAAGFSVIADLPGTDPSAAPVMIGAHLDSIHAAAGATDNAAGCSVVIEAIRAIAAAGTRPKRTIRLALWGGEEQGRRGSKAYVQAHQRDPLWAYFNVDRGAGPIDGLIIEGTGLALDAERWGQRLYVDGVRSITPMATGGSDHISFRDAGVPTVTFTQELRSMTTTHHSTADTIAEVREADLRQASVVVAIAAYLAAQ
jgi:carboxypeptidase Q